MSTKRRPIRRDQRSPAVSVEAVQAWRHAVALGRREGWQEAGKALHRALQIPWLDPSPLDVRSKTPPEHIRHNPAQLPEYMRAWELRQALLRAAADNGHANRALTEAAGKAV